MVAQLWVGMLIVFIAGLLNGSFTLPMKYSRVWSWENTWGVYSLVALLVLPWILAAARVPNLLLIYKGLSWHALVLPVLFGFLWGTAQTTFGLAVKVVGMAVAFAVVCGLVCLTGSLIPMLAFNPGDVVRSAGLIMLVSMLVLLLGLVLYVKAGNRRQNERGGSPDPERREGLSFKAGLVLCVFTGIFGSAWNLGFAFSGDTLRRSMQLGASPIASTYVVWALVLLGGLLPNLSYSAYLVWKRRTWRTFAQEKWQRESALGLAMAFLWFSAIVSYGIGATLIGKYGTSVGFTLYIAATILASSVLGIATGEWKGISSQARRLLAMGVAAIFVSVLILNLGGRFLNSR